MDLQSCRSQQRHRGAGSEGQRRPTGSPRVVQRPWGKPVWLSAPCHQTLAGKSNDETCMLACMFSYTHTTGNWGADTRTRPCLSVYLRVTSREDERRKHSTRSWLWMPGIQHLVSKSSEAKTFHMCMQCSTACSINLEPHPVPKSSEGFGVGAP